MVRLVAYLLAVLLLATGLSWLADRPGNLLVTWEGYEIETSVFRAVVILAALIGLLILTWSIVRQIWASPALVSHFLTRRRHRRGLDALSSGMIAIGAGDRSSATRYAVQARKALPNEPLTHLLRAQAAQLSGDRTTARRIFEAMLASPDTEQLGLRGLYLEAAREGEPEAARQFAERAARLNPRLGWPLEAQFDLQCKARDWAAAIETVSHAKKAGLMDKPTADRRRAVLLAAQAQDLEESEADKALALASEAHGLAPDLIAAAAVAGRILAARGQTAKAAKIIQKTWVKAPHPELAAAYAYARIGDSPRDRLDRIKQLAQSKPHDVESAMAVATAAIEARAFDVARHALQPFLDERMTRRMARLMARIEGEEHGDAGRVRAWLAKAATAGNDPAWTADGVILDAWSPISPVTGKLDTVVWRSPVTGATAGGATLESEIDSWLGIEAAPSEAAPAPEAQTIDVIPTVEVTSDALADGATIPEPASAPDAVAEPETEAPPPPARKKGPSARASARSGRAAAQSTSPEAAGTPSPITDPPHAPDDPGAEGEDLVPEIRTSRTAPTA